MENATSPFTEFELHRDTYYAVSVMCRSVNVSDFLEGHLCPEGNFNTLQDTSLSSTIVNFRTGHENAKICSEGGIEI